MRHAQGRQDKGRTSLPGKVSGASLSFLRTVGGAIRVTRARTHHLSPSRTRLASSGQPRRREMIGYLEDSIFTIFASRVRMAGMNDATPFGPSGRHFLAGRSASLSAQIVTDVRE